MLLISLIISLCLNAALGYWIYTMKKGAFAKAASEIKEAAEAVPDEYVDMRSLSGPRKRIEERYQAWAKSGATSLILRQPDLETLQTMADIVQPH